MVWEKNLLPSEADMKEIEDREYEYEDESDALARWICNGGDITDDIFEKAFKEIDFISLRILTGLDSDSTMTMVMMSHSL